MVRTSTPSGASWTVTTMNPQRTRSGSGRSKMRFRHREMYYVVMPTGDQIRFIAVAPKHGPAMARAMRSLPLQASATGQSSEAIKLGALQVERSRANVLKSLFCGTITEISARFPQRHSVDLQAWDFFDKYSDVKTQ